MADQEKDNQLARVWSVVSHDLATPLFVIQSSLQDLDENLMPMLLEFYAKAKQAGVEPPEDLEDLLNDHKELLPDARSVVNRMRQMVSRWNHKLLTRKFQQIGQSFNIQACIESGIKNYQSIYGLADKSRAHLDVDDATVLGDANIFEHILYELLANAEYAVRANSNYHDHVIVSFSSTMDDKFYYLQVKSTGSAITVADLPKIFDPYFSTKTSQMGLGLTFCKQAMQSMQGDISCHTEDDGKTVIFTLTVAKDVSVGL